MTSNQLGNLVQISKRETKQMRNPWKPKFPESERIQRIQQMEKNKNIKIQDMLSTGVGVLLVSKVEVVVDNIELNCYKKRKEKEQLRLLFSTTVSWHRKTQTRFQFWFAETAGMVKWERHVVNGKVPQKTPFHFCPFHQRSLFSLNHFWNVIMKRARKHSKMRWFTHVEEWKWFRKDHLRVITWRTVVWKWLWEKWNDSAELFEFPLNNTQVYVSQMTVHYSVGVLVLHRNSWTKWELTKTERRVKWGELVEDGESHWRNLERKFGFVKLEKTVSVLLQAAWLK